MSTLTLRATATEAGVVEYSAEPTEPVVKSDWHDELQSWLKDKETVKFAGMTRATASSYCG